ncbi:MAG: GGDEF domain-containing protein [Phycisphaerae bacterium]|nr:GGDEF domain-containing protein [Phycisphaerae bacterium]
MSVTPMIKSDQEEARRLVVVAAGGMHEQLAEFVRGRYPAMRTVVIPSLLAGVVQAARDDVQAVLIPLVEDARRTRRAIAGMRMAGGREVRIVPVCEPALESQARELMRDGADDYVLLPPVGEEMDAALGLVREEARVRSAEVPPASTEELARFAETLSRMEGRPIELLRSLASLVQWALGARGVTVVAEGAVATAGEAVSRPVLVVPLEGASGVIGQITVSERERTGYLPAEVEKLAHYARITGYLLDAATRQRRLRRLAETDETSGLPNRRYLRERLGEILSRAERQRFAVTVLLFDIDNFKTFNDTCGHDAGDDIIRRVGELFRKYCREQDIVARYGGDEFAVVFWDAEGSRMAGSAPPQQALDVLDRFRAALHDESFPRLASEARAEVTISGGLATYPWDGKSAEELVAKADEALLAAKRAGKNRVFVIGEEEGT